MHWICSFLYLGIHDSKQCGPKRTRNPNPQPCPLLSNALAMSHPKPSPHFSSRLKLSIHDLLLVVYLLFLETRESFHIISASFSQIVGPITHGILFNSLTFGSLASVLHVIVLSIFKSHPSQRHPSPLLHDRALVYHFIMLIRQTKCHGKFQEEKASERP